MAILTIGLAAGWPLMAPTVSTEGTDTFDALSRSYAYVYQRPLAYLLYAVAATIIGILGLLVVLRRPRDEGEHALRRRPEL